MKGPWVCALSVLDVLVALGYLVGEGITSPVLGPQDKRAVTLLQ